ncbi:uncharacterized protein [Miscanthus floridulus]|uniref:uncharacterized protein n=1 Tax=Miscanthus floridulus TaxID=154761 RepID=UPI00345763A5
MEAYYKTVWRLEDKFDGLELNHVTRRYNMAADELAKIASGWTMIPSDTFARDLHKPSVDYGEPLKPTSGTEAPSAAELEVMEIQQDKSEADQETDWRVPFLDCLV